MDAKRPGPEPSNRDKRDLVAEPTHAAVGPLREHQLQLVCHDLRGPLSTARLAAALIDELSAEHGDHAYRGRQHELVLRIVRNLDRMERMIRDLLDAQRIRAGHGLSLELRYCELVAIIRDVIEELAEQCGDRFQVHGARSIGGLWSREELRRTLWNLLKNAVEHGAPDSPVVITARQDGDAALVAVRNHGPPIPERERTSLFRPFTRRECTVGQRSGWGLGLALVRASVEAHGGTIWVDSNPSATTFTMKLPLDARQPTEVGSPLPTDQPTGSL